MTWDKYRLFARDVAECTLAKAIRTTARLIVEAERQRKLTEEISEAQLILGTGMSIHFNWDISVTHSPVRHRGVGDPQTTLLPYAPAYSPRINECVVHALFLAQVRSAKARHLTHRMLRKAAAIVVRCRAFDLEEAAPLQR
ncbi:hypothetical protein FB451DRAFT_1198474 [Mycena latifolia]|nr:hypothetical protein FB451DRAFT_1198474 [Mycena latifolia]